MKKITLLTIFMLLSFLSYGQLPNGSTAPDFTATDINGNSHTLSTYLAQGKTVILDISATWCGPCWNYHNSHALADIYNAYGANGSNEVVVLFVEGDANTTLADLNGTGSNTQGDWVTGTPYPIIDSRTVAQLYQITYFPTVYRICPNGIVSEIGSASASSIRTGINANCGLTLSGVQNHVEAYDSVVGACVTTGSPAVKLRNLGSNAVAAAVVNLKENGTTVATKTSSGSFSQFVNKTVTFDPMTLNPSSTYTFEIATVNGATNFNPSLSTSDLDVEFSAETSQTIEVRVYTDNYPTEIGWRIKNGTTVVASGGPYVGNANGGGADANTTKIHAVTLPAAETCYTIELTDSYGDGWGYGSTPHGLEVYNSSNTLVFSEMVSNFGSLLTKSNALRTVALRVNDFDNTSFVLYPNPSNGIVNFQCKDSFDVEVYDVLGKVVFTKNNNPSNATIDFSSALNTGVYMVKMKSQNAISTQKLIINK